MKNTLIYCFSFFSLANASLFAQDTIVKPENNEVKISQRYGLRIGMDLLRASRNLWDKNYNGMELFADYRYNKKLYLAAETGYESKYKAEQQLSYTTKGNYLKIGADYNLHNNWGNLENMVYVGGRYGISFHQQTLHSYKIISADNYFGETELHPNLTSSGLHAHWIDLVGGVKSKIYNNLFLGFSIRLSYLIAQKQPQGFENLYIPGYGQKYSGKIGASFHYGISYFIPLSKK